MKSLSRNVHLRQENDSLKELVIDRNKYTKILGNSGPVLKVLKMIQKVEKSNIMVLVTGQSGTGKELVARALHRLSAASPGRFVACNCSALVESLVESELFGYVKGAFTGAIQDRPGLFENADGGVIFLDEIGDLSIGAQAKLLRVLQDHHVRRVGSSVSRSGPPRTTPSPRAVHPRRRPRRQAA